MCVNTHYFMPFFIPLCDLKPDLLTNSFVFVRTQKMYQLLDIAKQKAQILLFGKFSSTNFLSFNNS